MKSFLGLVGVAVMVGSIGCGTTVNVLGGDDDDGEGGAGGGAGGSNPSGPTSTSSTGPTPPPPNPAECPATAPYMYDTCDIASLACAYLEEQGCTVSYTCIQTQDCYDDVAVSGTGGYDDDGGYGGYGDCYNYAYWQPDSASCVPSAVDCSVAQQGDTCALPGDYCSGEYGECSYTDKWCGDDHTWQISEYDDECCYDDCCYDDCYCEPYYCPDYVPEQGEYCDPCYDSSYCSYEIPDEYCGTIYASAQCNPNTYSWDIYAEGCTGTTVSVSASVGPGGGEGGWGTGGWDEGSGGFFNE